MSTIINDGTGKNFSMRVDSSNRARVHAVTESEQLHAIEEGDGYNINTGLISISGDGTLLYLMNSEDRDVVIESVVVAGFKGITFSDDPMLTIIKNPTGGDLITDATAVDMNTNRNFSSNNTFIGLAYKGKTSGTITGGSDIGIFKLNQNGRDAFGLNLLLQRGDSVALKYTGNISSGSANYYAAISMYVKEDTTD